MITFVAAFFGGMAAFLSPCVLPLIPSYLLYISGASAKEALIRKRPKTLILSIGFVLGIALIFSALGASASLIGTLLLRYKWLVEKIAGVIVIFLGLNVASSAIEFETDSLLSRYASKVMGVITFLPFLRHHHHEVEIGERAGSFLGAVLVGLSFGLSWTPCVGLELGAFYFLASQEATVLQGAGLLFTFASGLGLPFILAGLLLERFSSFYKKIGRHLRKIQVASGLMICALGVLVFTGKMEALTHWLVQLI